MIIFLHVPCSSLLDGFSKMLSMSISFRKWPSYFSRLPKATDQYTGTLDFEEACSCDETNGEKKCVEGVPVHFTSESLERNEFNRMKTCNRNPTRDVEGSDDLTEEDFQLFGEPIETKSGKRMKRSPISVSTDQASSYCAERIANTTVGKLCYNIGTDVQSLVDICSADIKV